MFKDLKLLGGFKEATRELFSIVHVLFVQLIGADRMDGHTGWIIVCYPLVQNFDIRNNLCKPSVEVCLELCRGGSVCWLWVPLCLSTETSRKRKEAVKLDLNLVLLFDAAGIIKLGGGPVDDVYHIVGRLDRGRRLGGLKPV
eukprot:12152309-Ditylum_brightwellii.AAC.1